jgi:putative DNA primase/helicase
VTTLTDFLVAFFPDEDEPIYLRAFKAKGAPDTRDNRPLVEVVTRRKLALDIELQNTMTIANRTRGWYFVVNAGGNADADITRFNAFFVENDSLPIDEQHRRLDAAPLLPSIRLETQKSVHAYWLIDDACAIDSWHETQERLIAFFDGDKSIKNPSRVIRS